MFVIPGGRIGLELDLCTISGMGWEGCLSLGPLQMVFGLVVGYFFCVEHLRGCVLRYEDSDKIWTG